jgi:hypothetical protein
MAFALEMLFAILAAAVEGDAPPALASITPDRLISAKVHLSPGNVSSRITQKSSGRVYRE